MKLLAQSLTFPGGNASTTITGPIGADTHLNSLGDVVTRAIPFIFLFAGVAMLLMLIFGGIGLITGANDPKKLEESKQRITWAIGGFLIVFLAFWIVQIVARMFGLTEFTAIFGG